MNWRRRLLVLVALLSLGTSLCGQTADVFGQLFPEGLIDREGNPVPLETLRGKFVGLYFSAEWCRGCQKFSPQLVAMRNEQAAGFEVVMVSSDKSEAHQFAYMKEYQMLWPTLRYRSAPADALRERFEVTSIPTLIVLSPDGRLVTRDGRTDVETAPAEAVAKWKATTPSPLPFSIAEPAVVAGADRLAQLDRQVIAEVNTLRSIPKQGWIKGTVGAKSYFLTFDRISWTIKGTIDGKPVDLAIDHDRKTIRGVAQDSGVDLTFTFSPELYGLDGEVYGYPYWTNIDWRAKTSNGGVGCSMFYLDWDLDRGKLTGFIGDRKVDLGFDQVSGRLTGDLARRTADLQIVNLGLTDFIQHFYLFLK